MAKENTPKAKKIIRQHDNYLVHITTEAKRLGWNNNTILKVYTKDGKIVIEKGMQL